MFAPRLIALGVALTLIAGGCGTSGSAPSQTSSPPPTASTPGSAPAPSGGSSSSGGAGALLAESQQAAAGDIPDNQVFLVYRNARGGYSMKYPEGWAIRTQGGKVTIRDKNNVIQVVTDHGPATVSQAAADMQALASSTPHFSYTRPQANPTCTNMGVTTKLPQASVHTVYTSQSAPDPVTGKRSSLSVDRYYLAHNGTRAIVDLGTPKGVDNVDAYCLMIASFGWR